MSKAKINNVLKIRRKVIIKEESVMNRRIVNKTKCINTDIKVHYENKDHHSPGEIALNVTYNNVRSDMEHLIHMSHQLGRIREGIAQLKDVLMLTDHTRPRMNAIATKG